MIELLIFDLSNISTATAFLLTGISIAGFIILGFIVFFNDSTNQSNKAFFHVTIFGASWSVLNFGISQFTDPEIALWMLRASVFSAVLYSYFLYRFYVSFSDTHFSPTPFHRFFIIPLLFLTAFVVLTPYTFDYPITFEDGYISTVTNGPGVILFSIVVFFLIFNGLASLVSKLRLAQSHYRSQLWLILVGSLITYSFILFFNLILPIVFDNPSFLPIAGLWLLPFLGITAYAIVRYGLFDIKIIAAEAILFVFSLIILLQVVTAVSVYDLFFKVLLFFLTLGVSIFLIRSVRHEIKQRELTEKLAEELAKTNAQQETLMHFIGHEVKGFMTKDMGAFAAMIDGDFGALPDGLKPFAEKALEQSRMGVRSVTNILTASNQKKGTIVYTKELFDLKALVEEEIEKAKSSAEEKGLKLSFSVYDANESYIFTGDKEKIEENVLRNLIENAINYTPSGSVAISLKKESDHSTRLEAEKYVIVVKDTGIGITEEGKKFLFTEGGHGKESQKINVHSTGYGLFIAKNIVEAHGGTIRAESDGEGKGATFVVEFPVSI